MKDLPHNRNMILHLIDSGGVYGIERMIMSLLPKLKQLGYDVALAYMNIPETPLNLTNNNLLNMGVKVYYLNYFGRISCRGILSINKTLNICKPRIVHFHGYKATIMGGTFCLLRNIPAVATYHGEAKAHKELSKYLMLENHFLKRLRYVAAVSTPIKKELEERKVKPHRIEIIPNGIDDLYIRGESLDNVIAKNNFHPAVLFTGRLIELKNVHILIEVISRLKKYFPDIGLLVAGDGPFRENLVQQVHKLNLSNSVIFLGYVENIYDLYYECDCFVLPSKSEGMPISLLEAMSFSLPIVASSVGSIPYIVNDGVEALLVEPNNIESLYKAMMQLLHDSSLRERLGNNARKRFLREYTSDAMAEKYARFYERALELK